MLHWKFGASIEVILHLPFHSVTTIMKHRIETLLSDLKGLISAEATLEQDWGRSLENRLAHCIIGHISIGHAIASIAMCIWAPTGGAGRFPVDCRANELDRMVNMSVFPLLVILMTDNPLPNFNEIIIFSSRARIIRSDSVFFRWCVLNIPSDRFRDTRADVSPFECGAGFCCCS